MKSVFGVRIRGLMVALCLCGIAQLAEAQGALADPTQPPAGFGTGDAAGVNAAGPVSRLTSVILPKKGQAAAVIDGKLVPVGGVVGDAAGNTRLVRVSEGEVVLEGPEGTERLYLTPGVEKKMNMTRPVGRRTKE